MTLSAFVLMITIISYPANGGLLGVNGVSAQFGTMEACKSAGDKEVEELKTDYMDGTKGIRAWYRCHPTGKSSSVEVESSPYASGFGSNF